MRKLLLIAGCFLSLCLVSASSSTPNFEAMYESYAGAVRAMNVDGYMGFFSADFRLPTSDGRELGITELTEAQRALATAMRVNSFEVTVQSVTPLATGDFDVVVLQKFDRDENVAGTSINLRNSVVRHEIWRNSESGWKILRVDNVLNGPTYRHVRHWL